MAFILALINCNALPAYSQQTSQAPASSSQNGVSGQELSSLELSVKKEDLAHFRLQEEQKPDGKSIESIQIYVLPVFDDRDPVPNFLNAFHVRSREWIIRQETLFKVGDQYDVGRVIETERNLRSLRQLSLANVIVAKGTLDDEVRLIIVVKDVWSLRVNSNFGIGQDGLEFLLLNPAEENIGGIHLDLGLLYMLDRARHSFGARVVYPRLAGSRYWLGIDFSVSVNRDSGRFEGTSGAFNYLLPLYSRYSKWGFGTNIAWRFEVTRRFQGGSVRDYSYIDSDGSSELIPETYETAILAGNYYATRSYGVLHKRDLTFGYEISSREYRPQALGEFSQAAQNAFIQAVLPVSDTRMNPYAQLRVYKTKFLRTIDFEILGLQEDIRLGYETLARVYIAGGNLGSSRSQVGARMGLSYTLPLGDGILRFLAQNSVAVAEEQKNQASVLARARFVSPRGPLGRLHVDGAFAYLYADYLNSGPYSLGGNNRLRGYGFDQFQGKNLAVVNAEFRTRSLEILSAQVGLAAFFDMGAVSNDLPSQFQQGGGFGGRVLFPQAERTVLRFDWGVPIKSDFAQFPGSFYVTFGQAFSLPFLSSPSITSGVSLF